MASIVKLHRFAEFTDRFFDDPQGALPPSSTATEPARREKKVMECGACGSSLAADGSVLARGEKHGEYLDQKDRIRKLEGQAEELRAALVKKDEEIAAVKEAAARRRRFIDTEI